VQDPDPNAVDSGRILGVRIDVFASRRREFGTPYYLLLNQPEGKDGRLRVHRHTIPVCIPLKALVENYLPFPKDGGDDLKGRPQDLARFVRAVRRECVALGKRVEAVEGLREKLGRAQVVGEVRGLDKEGREVEIEFIDKHVARVSVGTDGRIEKVVLSHGVRGGGASVRGKAIERIILGGDGSIEGLVGRLSEAAKR
jgi:central kinetochore subunit Mal2/MCM21